MRLRKHKNIFVIVVIIGTVTYITYSPRSPRFLHVGLDEQDPNGFSTQQSKNVPSADGQQSPVKFILLQTGFAEQEALPPSEVGERVGLFDGLQSPPPPSQQSRNVPWLVGQQSPSKLAHFAYAEHDSLPPFETGFLVGRPVGRRVGFLVGDLVGCAG